MSLDKFLLVVLAYLFNVQLTKPSDEDINSNKINEESELVNEALLHFLYWNSNLGNDKPIEIKFHEESSILEYWIKGLPLKLITHGWLGSLKNPNGVISIKTAYVDVGGYNIIFVDWSYIADSFSYPKAASMTDAVGSIIAEFLNNLVKIVEINPINIHLIGFSLGAHVLGVCGSRFTSGTIGRITGLEPAAPGFEYLNTKMKQLNLTDAEFVDVIHTTAGFIGYSKNIGHADYYPNKGKSPQPGCSIFDFKSYKSIKSILFCSHMKAFEYYADSVYHRKSLIATKCTSWEDFLELKCSNNEKVPMGHDAIPSARGMFFLKTNDQSPYGIP